MMTDEILIHETEAASPNFRTELAEQLAALVPEAVADGKIDVTKLQELLADDVADASERFGLFWPGKKRALRAAQEPTTATLRPDFEESKDWETTKNVFIEGDNLEVLKILQKHYHNKIKLIYIDPPYNTGRDFVYPDNYREGLETYLEWTKQVTQSGGRISTNSESEGRYHSNWLNMMYPRLKLARNLLTDDGVIFISIDDNEVDNLQKLCNEIFGETNFVASLVHQRAKGGGQAKYVVKGHDYVLCYARNIAHMPPLLRPKVIQTGLININGVDYIKNDDVVRRSFGKYDRSLDRRCFYEELEEIKGLEFKRDIDRKVALGELFLEPFRDTGMTVIYELKPVAESSSKVYSIIKALSEEGKKDLEALGLAEYFDYPKSVEFEEQIVQAACLYDKKAVILDFFAGSATTAHAVEKLNAEDGGERRWICVQLPEPTPDNSAARDAGFYSIDAIARERIRRAGVKIASDNAETLETRATPLDVGFRAYELTDSNFSKWQLSSDVEQDKLELNLLEMRSSSSDDDATPDDLLTEVLQKQGYSLTESIEPVNIDGLDVRSVGHGLVLAYLNEHVKPTLDQLRAVVAEDPAKIIVVEDAFQGDDELKTNIAQLCNSKNIEFWTA